MFIRGRGHEATPWLHARPEGDGFVFGTWRGLHEAHLAPNADRAVDLFVAVLEHFAPAGTLTVEDWRSGTSWVGDDLATADVRDAIARARHVVSAHAGTEVTLVSDGEQATLTANLEIHVFARTDRWLYLLQGKGLRRVRTLRPRSWRMMRGEFPAMPLVAETLAALADRLHLAPVPPMPR